MLALALAAVLASNDVPVVSVMYFDNNSGDADLAYMSKGLTDLLITDLVGWDGVRVVERTRLEEVLKELKFQQTKYVDKATAAQLGKVLNAGFLIYGSITMVKGPKPTMIVQARLVRALTGEVVFSVKETDDVDKIFDLEQRLMNQLVLQIDAKLVPNAAARRKARVPDLATVVAYGKALDLSDQGKLEEAQSAMRALVSKAPSFLLGRERQQQLLAAFEEYQKKRKDLIAGSLLDLSKVIDDVLKAEPKFDTLKKEEAERYLTMRMLRGRFLIRVLKQHLTNRDENMRVMRKGSEGKALLAMKDWVENQRRYMAEYARAQKLFATVYNGISYPPSLGYHALNDSEERLIASANIGSTNLEDYDVFALFDFVLVGRADDGTNFYVAPTLFNADPKEGKAVAEQLDLEIKNAVKANAAGDKQAQNRATRLMEFKAAWQLDQGNIDAAITSYQEHLDTFPTDGRNSWVEGRIKELLEGRGNEARQLQDWDEAIKTCDDMKIRVADRMLRKRMFMSGLKGMDDLAADIEKACLPATKRTANAFAQMYAGLAHTSATHDDCDRFRGFYRKYLEQDGSVSEMVAWQKHYPWCELGDVAKDVVWLRATLDGGWSFDMPRRPHSILSSDETVITISANTNGPIIPDGQEETFDLRLERQSNGAYKCTSARWRRYWGKYIEGTCNVTFTKQVPKGGAGYDEGSFDAVFEKAEHPDGTASKTVLSRGDFRVRRN